MARKEKKGAKGTASLYTTRNRALKKLQVKLPEFRRLSILKGIHPRDPKKKPNGRGKTYYHVKDVNFLLHEPLLDKFREQAAYDKKVVKAIGKNNEQLARKLQSRRPEATLDHLIRERYPTFIDALRDLDDPLTLVHLFAALPGEQRHEIAAQRCNLARRVCLEWAAYIVRTHALRKAFVSVKGIYFQAEVEGQTITWLTPHNLVQRLPDDVDYRVMVTFLEFYETLLQFVLFRLYHKCGLKYPPNLESSLEEAEVGVGAALAELSASSRSLAEADGGGAGRPSSSGANGHAPPPSTVEEDIAQEGEGDAHLFSHCVFFIGREVPREALVMLVASFGGKVGWEGPGSPFTSSSPSITHQIVDRPQLLEARLAERDYVQPQWCFDCINFSLLLPCDLYAPGVTPPPHLSPFVDNDAEGYTPEYAETIKRLQRAAEVGVNEMGGGGGGGAGDVAMALAGNDVDVAMEEETKAVQVERHLRELVAEASGVPFSAAQATGGGGVRAKLKKKKEEEEEEKEKDGGEDDSIAKPTEEEEEELMSKTMMTGKNRKLYERISKANARKESANKKLVERRSSARLRNNKDKNKNTKE